MNIKVSCRECSGRALVTSCPVCSPDPIFRACEMCEGEGVLFYDSDLEIISKAEYDLLQSGSRSKEPCYECDGVGEVEVIDVPDPYREMDEYYDNYKYRHL